MMAALLRLVRAPNLAIAAAGVLAGGWIALGRIAVPGALLLAAASGIALGACGNAWNDVWDVPADRVNRPGRRPLADGVISRRAALAVVAGAATAGLALALLVSAALAALGVVALAVMLAYSPVLKPRLAVGNLAVALVAGLPPLYGAVAVGRASAGVVPWTLAAWIHLAREIAKDVEDESGDRIVGRRTLPIVLGRPAARLAAAAVGFLFIPASLLLPRADGYGTSYFLLAIFAQMAVLLAATWLLLDRTARVSALLKTAMVIGIVALVAGKVT